MQGMFFVEILNNKAVSSGHIEKELGGGYFSVCFYPPSEEGVQVRRVLPAQSLQAFALFPNIEDMGKWMADFHSRLQQQPPQAPEGEPGEDLNQLTVAELRARAQALGIKYSGRAKKQELIDILLRLDEAS